jgi:hypothetical protein
LDGSLLPESG